MAPVGPVSPVGPTKSPISVQSESVVGLSTLATYRLPSAATMYASFSSAEVYVSNAVVSATVPLILIDGPRGPVAPVAPVAPVDPVGPVSPLSTAEPGAPVAP